MHGIESRKKTYVEAVVDIDPTAASDRWRSTGETDDALSWIACSNRARGEHEGRRPRDPLYR